MAADDLREKFLTLVIVALAVTPKHLWRRLFDGNALHSDPARHDVADRIADAIFDRFELVERPPPKSQYDR